MLLIKEHSMIEDTGLIYPSSFPVEKRREKSEHENVKETAVYSVCRSSSLFSLLFTDLLSSPFL